ncbi:MAG: ABC transporter permease [Bacteroidetes bacterium]|jgi:putative ABC transport system permease protein|nr:ABC transporter permease [Bacteroidota bacterium]
MKFIEALRFALRSIRGYRLRALLTILGISFGIFTITFVFTLVNTMKEGLSANLNSLGNTVIFVHHWPWKDNSEDWYQYVNRDKMRYTHYVRLRNSLGGLADALYFQADLNGVELSQQGRTATGVKLRGVTQDYLYLSGSRLASGRDFSPYEAQSGRKVCILGQQVARSLFGSQPALGRTLRFRGQQLRVIGVLEQAGLSLFGSSADEDLIIPYALMAQLYQIEQRAIDKVIAVKARRYEELQALENQVMGQMRIARGLRPDQENDFAINKQESLVQSVNQIFEVLNTGGVFISLLSLLVGGFGIANIMFVSVKERTREIGIQKALGSTRGFILLQFLLESVSLCLLGGLLGILLLFVLAGVAQLIVSRLALGLSVAIAPWDLALGLLLSVLIGLISGLIPSYLAARMDPVEAMRH